MAPRPAVRPATQLVVAAFACVLLAFDAHAYVSSWCDVVNGTLIQCDPPSYLYSTTTVGSGLNIHTVLPGAFSFGFGATSVIKISAPTLSILPSRLFNATYGDVTVTSPIEELPSELFFHADAGTVTIKTDSLRSISPNLVVSSTVASFSVTECGSLQTIGASLLTSSTLLGRLTLEYLPALLSIQPPLVNGGRAGRGVVLKSLVQLTGLPSGLLNGTAFDAAHGGVTLTSVAVPLLPGDLVVNTTCAYPQTLTVSFCSFTSITAGLVSNSWGASNPQCPWSVSITSNPSLLSLPSPLLNASITELTISDNTVLASLPTLLLPPLTVTTLRVSNNGGLVSIPSNMTGMAPHGNVSIVDNWSLVTIGDNAVRGTTNDLFITGNAHLAIVPSFSGLHVANDVVVSLNTALHTISARLVSCANGNVHILSNPSLFTIGTPLLTCSFTELKIRQNDALVSIPAGLWENNLHSLEISHNPSLVSIGDVPGSSPSALSVARVEYIDILSNTNLVSVGAFPLLSVTREVYLSSLPKLSTLPPSYLCRDATLIRIHDAPALRALPRGVCMECSTISVYLEGTGLAAVPDGFFDNTTYVYTFSLTANTPPPGQGLEFGRLVSPSRSATVDRLEIQNSGLTSVPPGIASYVGSRVNLFDNSITQLPVDELIAVANQPIDVYLSGNNIWGIPPALVPAIQASARTWSMSGNDFVCDQPVTGVLGFPFCYVCGAASGMAPTDMLKSCSWCPLFGANPAITLAMRDINPALNASSSTTNVTAGSGSGSVFNATVYLEQALHGWTPRLNCSMCGPGQQRVPDLWRRLRDGEQGMCGACPTGHTAIGAHVPGCKRCSYGFTTLGDDPMTAVCTSVLPCPVNTHWVPPQGDTSLESFLRPQLCESCGPLAISHTNGSCVRCDSLGFQRAAVLTATCVNCPVPARCLNNGSCVWGFTGRVCTTCRDNWYMLFGNCYPCTGGTWWLPALIGGIGFAVIGLLSFTGVLSAGRWHMIRQAASLVQVTSLQISIGIPWPDFVDISFSMFEGFFGEFGVFAPECAVKTSRAMKSGALFIVMVLCVYGTAGVYMLLGFLASCRRWCDRKRARTDVQRRLQSGLGILTARTRMLQLVTSIMLLLYLPLMKSAFSLWGCTQDEDGSPVWVGDDNIVCDSGEYWTITVLGGIVAVMCAILPGVLMVVLYQLERSGNLHASSEGVALAPAYDGYRPGRGMFEGCVLAMKVCTLVCFVFAEREDSEEGVQWWSVGDAAFANMVIIGLYMLAVTVLMPWRDHEVHILCWLVPNAHNITGVVSAWATAGAAAASWLRSGYDEPAPLWLVWYQSGCGALIGMVVAVQTLIVVQGSAHSIRYSRSTEARAASRSLKARQAQRTSLFIMGASSSRLKIGRSAEPDGTELVSLNPLASREVVDVIADAMPRATKETLESQADEEALMLVPNNSVLCAEAANRRTKAQRTYSTKSSVRGMVRTRRGSLVSGIEIQSLNQETTLLLELLTENRATTRIVGLMADCRASHEATLTAWTRLEVPPLSVSVAARLKGSRTTPRRRSGTAVARRHPDTKQLWHDAEHATRVWLSQLQYDIKPQVYWERLARKLGDECRAVAGHYRHLLHATSKEQAWVKENARRLHQAVMRARGAMNSLRPPSTTTAPASAATAGVNNGKGGDGKGGGDGGDGAGAGAGAGASEETVEAKVQRLLALDKVRSVDELAHRVLTEARTLGYISRRVVSLWNLRQQVVDDVVSFARPFSSGGTVPINQAAV